MLKESGPLFDYYVINASRGSRELYLYKLQYYSYFSDVINDVTRRLGIRLLILSLIATTHVTKQKLLFD